MSDELKSISVLARSGAAAPIDIALARFLAGRAAGESAEAVALAAALLGVERERGQSCIRLEEWAGRPFPGEGRALPAENGRPEAARLPELPGLDVWRSRLRASGLAGDGSEPSPLVLDGRGRLYLYRYWRAEQRLAARIRERLALPPEEAGAERAVASPLFEKLFPPPAGGTTDWQAEAAAAALRRRFTIVTGGPGTGKTFTVARILALHFDHDPGMRAALAAPTGKAAARMTEVIRGQAERLPLDDDLRRLLVAASEAKTIHRLLRYLPPGDRFRHHAGNPLAADCLVVDEASMVDLLLMDALFDALQPRTRVILLGDEDQLASVEAGYVLGDLCRAADAEPAGESAGETVGEPGRAEVAEPVGSLRESVIRLRRSWRFEAHPGIGELAGAIRAGDADRALAVLGDEAHGDVRLSPHPATAVEALTPLAPQLDAWAGASTPAEALERLGAFRVLCAARAGRWSVAEMNAAVEARLRAAGRRLEGTHYRGRPVMVTANDYQVGLFNGDIGVCWPDEEGTAAWFPSEGPEPRRVSLSRLPPHETAWALTVHKSQGSEFDRVLLVFPAEDRPLLTRELLYTGVTRARSDVTLLGPEDLVRAAVSRSGSRGSGLAEAVVRAGGI